MHCPLLLIQKQWLGTYRQVAIRIFFGWQFVFSGFLVATSIFLMKSLTYKYICLIFANDKRHSAKIWFRNPFGAVFELHFTYNLLI